MACVSVPVKEASVFSVLKGGVVSVAVSPKERDLTSVSFSRSERGVVYVVLWFITTMMERSH